MDKYTGAYINIISELTVSLLLCAP